MEIVKTVPEANWNEDCYNGKIKEQTVVTEVK
jgi:hypothetical protein